MPRYISSQQAGARRQRLVLSAVLLFSFFSLYLLLFVGKRASPGSLSPPSLPALPIALARNAEPLSDGVRNIANYSAFTISCIISEPRWKASGVNIRRIPATMLSSSLCVFYRR